MLIFDVTIYTCIVMRYDNTVCVSSQINEY